MASLLRIHVTSSINTSNHRLNSLKIMKMPASISFPKRSTNTITLCKSNNYADQWTPLSDPNEVDFKWKFVRTITFSDGTTSTDTMFSKSEKMPEIPKFRKPKPTIDEIFWDKLEDYGWGKQFDIPISFAVRLALFYLAKNHVLIATIVTFFTKLNKPIGGNGGTRG